MVTSKDSETKVAADAAKPVEKAPPKPKKTAAPAKATPKEAKPVKGPQKTCTDQFCPFHGILPVRGQILEGEVITDGMQNTVVVKRNYMRKNQKYERLEKRSSKYLVHSPPCFEAGVGDHVKIMECRPLSKLVSFVIIDNMGKE